MAMWSTRAHLRTPSTRSLAALVVVGSVLGAAITAGTATAATSASAPPITVPATTTAPSSTPVTVEGDDATVTGALASFYRPPEPLPYAPAGSIIRSRTIASGPGMPIGAHAYRVLFHSTSATGGDLAESGPRGGAGRHPSPVGSPS